MLTERGIKCLNTHTGAQQHAAFGVFRTKCETEIPLGDFEPKTQKTSAQPKFGAENFGEAEV